MKIEQIPDAIGVSVSSKTTACAGTVGILSGMMDWNWTAIIASTVAIIGLCVNIFFQLKRHSREKEEYRLKTIEHQMKIDLMLKKGIGDGYTD